MLLLLLVLLLLLLLVLLLLVLLLLVLLLLLLLLLLVFDSWLLNHHGMCEAEAHDMKTLDKEMSHIVKYGIAIS